MEGISLQSTINYLHFVYLILKTFLSHLYNHTEYFFVKSVQNVTPLIPLAKRPKIDHKIIRSLLNSVFFNELPYIRCILVNFKLGPNLRLQNLLVGPYLF